MSDHDRDPAVGPEPTGGAIGGLFSEPAEAPTEERTGQPQAAPAAPAYDPGGRRRRRKSRLPGYLAVIVVLALVGVGGYYGVQKGTEFLRSLTYTPEDYDGPGRGRVLVEVGEGETATDICRVLADEDVVASVDACISAANVDPDAAGIQVGYYQLQRQMSAADAIDVLVDPANLLTTTVTVPEGLTVRQIVDTLAKNTDFSKKQFNQVLSRPGKIGLPDYADGNAEGYLFPATYAFAPTDKPVDMVSQMVERWRQAADEANLEARAEALGYTPGELMVVASLVQAEGRGDDMVKVARVIYNRVENPQNGITNGLLQIDAAVNYALDQSPIARLTTDQIDSVADSPYNTYTQTGLPPTPIEAPGDDAIEAAANPAKGDWLFYVTVNLATGKTKFTDSYSEFLSFRQELDDYCATQSDRC
ncbi:endolytic transglycosylase MltG [Nocardioides bruguierae]|uniref:endolytic transglycosylase MltG n=1 Tax=Nocardioides bruguierae TaxID=2945102 RepID=UPI0020229048|nr:endolytic transglycosylase MltG [Nocardioides bruguierae]MCL8024235.1 endolytic transglycosylase MltG [Nocardioides bruguierae]